MLARPIVDAVAVTAEVLLEVLCHCSAKPFLGSVANSRQEVCVLGMGVAHHCAGRVLVCVRACPLSNEGGIDLGQVRSSKRRWLRVDIK